MCHEEIIRIICLFLSLLQTAAPADTTLANNWLPISADNFHLYLRIYLPQKTVLDGTRQPPTIKKTK
ncbi:MAG: hypothetical protein CVU99_02045 [Firmicutes bacterium HGW-Firmicutes-4]|jgi:hypothetical protein|nr:MAG: hypothetical protein CVU99_02045 [Firmicutes bacterium HGW-Firmicutes-4]